MYICRVCGRAHAYDHVHAYVHVHVYGHDHVCEICLFCVNHIRPTCDVRTFYGSPYDPCFYVACAYRLYLSYSK